VEYVDKEAQLLPHLSHDASISLTRRTIGDCYVAASGIPEPRTDHALAMARFAQDILQKCSIIVKQLEVSLGPDTAYVLIHRSVFSRFDNTLLLQGAFASSWHTFWTSHSRCSPRRQL
jgi:Adenylate and Guanylate cyclase catalytic domain